MRMAPWAEVSFRIADNTPGTQQRRAPSPRPGSKFLGRLRGVILRTVHDRPLDECFALSGDFGNIIALAMKSHTVPRFLLDQFAYDDPITKSRRLWQYAKGRPPSGLASPTSATRIDRHFADPANSEREAELEIRLNKEFENPVHQFLGNLRYRTFVLSRLHTRQLTRYVTLLFNRSENRRRGTKEQIAIAIESTRALILNEGKLSEVAAHWTLEMIRLGYQGRPVDGEDVKKSAERMIAAMQTEGHQQTTYVDSMERAMAFLDEALDNGQWNVMHTIPDIPFVIGDAPVVTWQRLENGTLFYGQGFATPNVEVVLPVASTACLHILPAVPRTLQLRQPTVKEVNEAQSAFATNYCYAHKNDPVLNEIVQRRFGQSRIGINVFSIRHRNYDDTMFELLMSGGCNFRAPRR